MTLCDDDTYVEGSPLYKWGSYLTEASEKLGAPFSTRETYRQLLMDAGFQDVVEVTHKWPMNTWPKDPKHKELGRETRWGLNKDSVY